MAVVHADYCSLGEDFVATGIKLCILKIVAILGGSVVHIVVLRVAEIFVAELLDLVEQWVLRNCFWHFVGRVNVQILTSFDQAVVSLEFGIGA